MSKRRKRKPSRRRGGASSLCPECQSPSRVLDTRRGENSQGTCVVVRQRECRKCEHLFTTKETAA